MFYFIREMNCIRVTAPVVHLLVSYYIGPTNKTTKTSATTTSTTSKSFLAAAESAALTFHYALKYKLFLAREPLAVAAVVEDNNAANRLQSNLDEILSFLSTDRKLLLLTSKSNGKIPIVGEFDPSVCCKYVKA